MESRFAALPEEYEGKCVFDYEYTDSDITSVPAFKKDAEHIETYAFNNCANLSFASFPSCIGIWEYAFNGCVSLKELYAPECQFIENYAFEGCTSLEKVTLGSNLRELPVYALRGTLIKEISLNKCSIIETAAFADCAELSKVNLPNCTSVAGYVFENCIKLESINMPHCLTLGNAAFHNCTSLSLAYFPKCYTFEETTFQNCANLKTLIIGTEVDGVITLQNSRAFGGTPMEDGTNGFGSIYVKDALVEDYKAFPNWSTYSDRITGISNLPESIKSKLDN